MEDPPWLPDYEAHLKATGMHSHLSRTLRVARDLYAGLGWNPGYLPYHFMQGVHLDIITTNLEGYKAQFKQIFNVDNDSSRGGRFRTPFYHLVKYQHIVRERAANPPLQLNAPALPVAKVVELVDEAEEMEVVEAPPPPVVQIAPPRPPPPLPPPLPLVPVAPPPAVVVPARGGARTATRHPLWCRHRRLPRLSRSLARPRLRLRLRLRHGPMSIFRSSAPYPPPSSKPRPDCQTRSHR